MAIVFWNSLQSIQLTHVKWRMGNGLNKFERFEREEQKTTDNCNERKATEERALNRFHEIVLFFICIWGTVSFNGCCDSTQVASNPNHPHGSMLRQGTSKNRISHVSRERLNCVRSVLSFYDFSKNSCFIWRGRKST